MKESYECEVATHIGPESCGAAREGGVGMQPRKRFTPGRRRRKEMRKAPFGAPIPRGALESRAVRDPVHVQKHLAREPGDPRFAQDGISPGTHREV